MKKQTKPARRTPKANNPVPKKALSPPTKVARDSSHPFPIVGYEARKILRSDPATAHIPVVAVSANAMLRDTAKGLEGGILPLSHQTH
jgi:hypothetical protein